MKMDQSEIKRRIAAGRAFMHMDAEDDPDYTTDQYAGVKQPPLFKDPVSDVIITLPKDFENLNINNDFLQVINTRVSSRIYREEEMSLLELSFILWCAQGVKGIRGKSYATLRTVPCGGARHESELYLCVQHVQGLSAGHYHYLPQNHSLELLNKAEDVKLFISESLNEQAWAAKAGVVFYFDMVAYRAEWRYGIYAHRIALVDAGYISENIYLACTALGLGSCAIGSIEEAISNRVFGLDGNEEFIFMAHPVGKIAAEDHQKELDFYAFVKENNL